MELRVDANGLVQITGRMPTACGSLAMQQDVTKLLETTYQTKLATV